MVAKGELLVYSVHPEILLMSLLKVASGQIIRSAVPVSGVHSHMNPQCLTRHKKLM